MRDAWVCGDCRAVNLARQTRCYNCRVLRSAGEMTSAAAALTSSPVRREGRTLHETANRMGARYRPSWPIAILVPPLIIVVLAMTIALLNGLDDLIGADGQVVATSPTTEASIRRLWTLLVWAAVANVASFLAWSLWIALVVRNVPALTAKWPPNSPIGAFFAAWIPIINLKRPYSVVRGVLLLLTPGRLGPQLIALAWWLFWLASYFGSLIAGFAYGPNFPTPLSASLFAAWVGIAFLIPSGILAVTLVVVVELAQHVALRDRDKAVVGPEPTPALP